MSGIRRRVRAVAVLAVAVSPLLLGGGSAVALISDVDPGFGTGGSTTVPVGGSADVGGIVQRPDGAFVIGASVGTNFTTVALTQGGDLLDTYGTGGISSVPIPGTSDVTATDVAVQPNGRVVVTGWENVTTGTDRFVVARFRVGGTPDESFSGDGVAFVPFQQGGAYSYGVTVQADGSIVVVGEIDPSKGVSNPAVARLDPDGTLDGSFGDHGREMIRLPDGVQGYDSPWRVVPQSHGKIAMAGWIERPSGTNYKTLALRLRSDGSLDPAFSGDGMAVVDADGVDNYAYGLASDGGKLVMGVHTNAGDAGFVRLNADGSRDQTFDGDGVALHTMSGAWEALAVAVLEDHRVVAVNGYSGGPNVLVVRPRGALDTGYSADGEGVGPLSGAVGEGLVVLANGKVVVTGTLGADVIAERFFAP
jgi:uncharacterized delta-60 repeat protein